MAIYGSPKEDDKSGPSSNGFRGRGGSLRGEIAGRFQFAQRPQDRTEKGVSPEPSLSSFPEPMTPRQVKKLLLHGQGLLDPPRRRKPVAEILDTLGYVQVDSINVFQRAHHTILGARWDGYRPHHLKRYLEKERGGFEQWTHDACVIPTRFYPHWRVKFQRFERRIKENGWWQGRMGEDPSKMQREVLERLQEEGPLPTRAFRDPAAERGKWWGWTPQKTALEYLWRTGRLAIAGRDQFQKIYDLPERVIPPEVLEQPAEDTLDWSCRQAIQRLGLATATEIANFWHFYSGHQVKPWCEKHLPKVTFEGNEFYIRPDWQEVIRDLPDPPARLRFLSPFDPLIRDRQRLQCFFDFDYRFEAFVPAKKRQYGYYVLPMLLGDRLVGRVDLKLDRKQQSLNVVGVWWEGRPCQRAFEAELERHRRKLL